MSEVSATVLLIVAFVFIIAAAFGGYWVGVNIGSIF